LSLDGNPPVDAALLRVDNLGRRFRLPQRGDFWAVRNATFELHTGEALGLVGESGSGKSTLGRMLLGLLDKTEGSVHFDGQLLPQRYGRGDFKLHARHLQMVFQDAYGTLNPRWTIGASLAEPLRLLGETDDVDARIGEALQQVGLAPALAAHYPHEFSGGQRQRVGIARALLARPRLLVCDEPVSALDVSVQAQIINLLMRLRRDLGLSLILISHDLAVVRHVCDRVAVMQRGAIVELAPTEPLYGNPQHPFTRQLLAARQIVDPRQRVAQ
jgi:peptide/nickel transport system ATP-binding protein